MKSLLLILGLVYTLFGGTYDYVYTAKDKVDANETAKSLDFFMYGDFDEIIRFDSLVEDEDNADELDTIVKTIKQYVKDKKEIKIKIIEIIYKFLMPRRNILRYAKVIKALDLIEKKSSITTNLAGMHINKGNFFISFML